MAIMFVRAQMISRGAGRNIISAAAYRHRTRMVDEQRGVSFSFKDGDDELRHEELALPEAVPAWLQTAIEGKTAADASETLWNAVDAFETRVNAQFARELIIALPEELTLRENISLVREFVRDNLTSRGMIADWVYHDRDGNPHVHVLTTLRPLTAQGFGLKVMPVPGDDGKPLRVAAGDQPKGRIVYTVWAGNRETMKAWKIAWAQTASRYLALAGRDIRLDGRSHAEQGLDGIAQRHLGPGKSAMMRKGVEMYFAPADLARRRKMTARLLADPEPLLRQLGNERSTFDEKDIARVIHRYVDDPADFANIRARLMASPDLVLLKPQQSGALTDPIKGRVNGRVKGEATEPAIFTTRKILRTEHNMMRSADILSGRKGFGISDAGRAAALRFVEEDNPLKPFRLDLEQIEAIQHVTGDSGIAAVVGLAGTGKSTLLAAARLAWESGHHRVLGAALSGKAAEGLEESSAIRSRTLAAWEHAWNNGRDQLMRGDILVIDEAGMVSSLQMARVLDAVEKAGAKVVLVGDAMQLQPIGAGAAFRAISERISSAELAGVRRQQDEWARDASKLFARGDTAAGLEIYARRGHLVEAETRDALIGRLVRDWTDARRKLITPSQTGRGVQPGTGIAAPNGGGQLPGDALLVLAHTNRDVHRLNEALRKVMREEGALDGARRFRTERGMREFAAGDRIIFLENARFLEPRARGNRPQYVRNGMFGTVVSTGNAFRAPLLSVRLDSGNEIVLSEDSYRNIDHGYAVTIHKSQGATVDRTLVLASGMMDRHLTCVSMTRHRHRADLYAAREDFRPEREDRSRIDYAKGITGELVETGVTKFRSWDEDTNDTPYADLKVEGGKVHRLRGVGLPAALSAAGASKGDTVTLRKDGVETVSVKIAVPDAQGGERRFEERTVERNVWTARLHEATGVRRKSIEGESHTPELFRQLAKRLGRSGAKTTTLDFAGEAGYQAHVRDFARRRGIDTLAGIVAGTGAGARRQLAWLSQKRQQVAMLWERAGAALGLAIDRERRVSYHERQSGRFPMQNPTAPMSLDRNSPGSSRTRPTDNIGQGSKACNIPPLLAAVTEFTTPVEVEARERASKAALHVHNRSLLAETAMRIWREPANAVETIETLIRKGIAGDRIAAAIANDPAAYGALRGSGRLRDRLLAVGRERKTALEAVPDVQASVRSLGSGWASALNAATTAIAAERQQMETAIPGLSEEASEELRRITTAMQKKNARLDVLAGSLEPHIRREFTSVSRALDLRFGRNAILRGDRDNIKRVPPAQHSVFEGLQDTLKVLQQTVSTARAQEIAAIRQSQKLDRGQDFRH
ncbi:Ti-type conjugative transfer relaxase TraA [Brucella intermedia LMG 3301]|uniref:Ti-type conjugative transfer relaxase TraA n=3 Tax=Brucella/Ochrobactrum group TaxID=2826938 RepID=C4WLD2_9HYPH|nr:Ti-type conjugative transfer relaxase TraA [Brucella intermedia]EEQ92954.1 Ti-type conjugative transfer relaxase TraA [Brucella intermedia LMG 3301]SUA87657.1 DNA strand transferase [Brucella intermedia]